MTVAIAMICFMAACSQPACTSERIDLKTGTDCGHTLCGWILRKYTDDYKVCAYGYRK